MSEFGTSSRARPFSQSLGKKLGLAVGSIALATIIFTIVAVVGFRQVSDSVSQFGEQTMPRLRAAIVLKQVGGEISADTARLASAASESERDAIAGRLSQSLSVLVEAADTLMAGTAGAADADSAAIAESLTGVRDVVGALRDNVSLRLQTGKKIAGQIAAILTAKQELDAALGPYLEDQTRGTKQTIDLLLEDVDANIMKLLELTAGFGVNQSLHGLTSIADRLVGVAIEATTVERADQLEALAERRKELKVWVQDRLSNLLADSSEGAVSVREKSKLLVAAAVGEEGADILETQRQVLRVDAAGQELVAAGNRHINTLLGLIDRVTTRATDDGAAAIDRADRVVSATQAILIGLSVASILFAFAIGYFYISRRVVARIARLADNMRQLADGDLAVETVKGPADEIGDMAEAMEIFRDNAREVERLTEDQEKAKQAAERTRREALQSLADGFNARVASIVGDLEGSVTRLVSSSQAMSGDIDTAAQRSQDVAQATTGAADNVGAISSASQALLESTQDMTGMMGKAASAAQAVVTDVEATDRAVEGLSKAAEKIGDVVQIISDIAEQTNLLALNATIEAARAGDAGKGFAVVANEVKTLAGQTAAATTDITAQVAAIKSTVQAAVNAMSKVSNGVGEVDVIVGESSNASLAQSESTREIVARIQATASEIRTVTDGVQDVVRTAGQTRSGSDTVLDAVETVRTRSSDLSSELSKFVADIRTGTA
ncbi:methyl-accepting chemotaxis protein [Hwanghaeella grinnelliae]|nr:HAMP domain-containing methyl-accepting chemotaxis protein [Hwanghaeella grinnelliae]